MGAVDDAKGEGETGVDDKVRGTCTMVANNTFQDISKRLLGSDARYTEIKSLNGLTTNIITTCMALIIPRAQINSVAAMVSGRRLHGNSRSIRLAAGHDLRRDDGHTFSTAPMATASMRTIL